MREVFYSSNSFSKINIEPFPFPPGDSRGDLIRAYYPSTKLRVAMLQMVTINSIGRKTFNRNYINRTSWFSNGMPVF